MCGIAGIYGSFSYEARDTALGILSKRLAHRGPDGNGVYKDDTIGLVHTRLSIIDLSENGNQPLYNETKDLVLVCNGEIYNYRELKAGLLRKGHKFSSYSDSEVIVHLYEEHRDDPATLLSLLTGMFAFAIWDTKKQKLFIARDRIGIKPLYFSYQGGNFLFSSEVKPIASTGLINNEIDLTSLYEYFLLGSIPGPNTLYKGIKCLEPGHYLVLENSWLSINEYWDISCGLKKWANEHEALEATESLLLEIVKDHLVADVPVGTFLSAGVDSSLITAMAVSLHPGIHSFTASFPGEPEDEGAIAAETARKLGTTHHTYALKQNFFSDINSLFHDIDQPFAISSALSLGRISKVARQEVKVALSGDGGDELFGGYHRHEFPKRPRFLQFIPQVLQNDVLKIGAKISGKESIEKLRKNLQIPEAGIFFDRLCILNTQTALSLFPAHLLPEIDTDRFLNRLNVLFDKRRDDEQLNRTLYADMKTALVDEMLTKCDRMTMISGIEGRVPFLDHRLVELAFSMPASFKRKDGSGKLILRKLLAKRLGNDLAFREKTGFNSPLKQWLTNDQPTIDFVNRNIGHLKKLPFIGKDVVKNYKQDSQQVNSKVIFSLVCLNLFFDEDNSAHK